MTIRWNFLDTVTDETWTVPINPNTMTDPLGVTREFQFGAAHGQVDGGGGRPRTLEGKPQIVDWSFGGVIYTKAHYDKLNYWAQKTTAVRIKDHLGRTFEVAMKSFEPVDRRPTPAKPWRFTYTMRALVLRRVG